ncbi:MAG TPA: antibiotic biosynthesis monooxygenase [Patescibacteria group bacterium]|nr:antibiotic biosynthesis monooxygenase [Patescibacteria group bacterium]
MSEAVVVVRYQSVPEQAETAAREIAALVAAVLAAEPECRGITMLQDADDPSRFMLVERWPSRALFLGPHMQQPHIQAFIARAGGFLAGPPEISFWHTTGGA